MISTHSRSRNVSFVDARTVAESKPQSLSLVVRPHMTYSRLEDTEAHCVDCYVDRELPLSEDYRTTMFLKLQDADEDTIPVAVPKAVSDVSYF